MSERWKWRLWGWFIKLPRVCPANAHSWLIWDRRRGPFVDSTCRTDCARNGVCYCGKIRSGSA